MSEKPSDREEGVDFTDIGSVLEEITYPITADDFVAEYGDLTVDRTNADPITVRELFESTGDDTAESADEIRQSLLNLMPRDSVGRQRYSDRAGAVPEETLEGDQRDEHVSL